jgi:intracellular septation protein A
MNKKRMMFTLLADVILPYAVYFILHSMGVSDIVALSVGGGVSVIRVLIAVLRNGKMDALALLICCFFAIGIVTSLMTGNARFLIIKESFVTGFFALVMIGSLLFGQPLTFYISRQFMGNADFEEKWQRTDSFRSALRLLTLVWGIGYLLEAVVRIAIVPHMAEKGFGRIVYVAAGPAKHPAPGMIAHGSAKAALAQFAKYIALEYGPKGITANVISPGMVSDTAGTESIPDPVKARLREPNCESRGCRQGDRHVRRRRLSLYYRRICSCQRRLGDVTLISPFSF